MRSACCVLHSFSGCFRVSPAALLGANTLAHDCFVNQPDGFGIERAGIERLHPLDDLPLALGSPHRNSFRSLDLAHLEREARSQIQEVQYRRIHCIDLLSPIADIHGLSRPPILSAQKKMPRPSGGSRRVLELRAASATTDFSRAIRRPASPKMGSGK